MVDEQMVIPVIEEVAEPVAEAKEEQVIAPAVDMEEGQMDVPVMDMEDDLATLFGDDDFEDGCHPIGFGGGEEASEDVYEVGGPSIAVAEGPSFPHLASGLPVPPFVIEDLSTRLGNLEYGHRQLVQRVNQVSDAEVAAGVTIGELGLRVYAIEGQVEQGQQTAAQRDETIAKLTQQVQALQIYVQQRDTQVQQLQTTVTEMGSRESTLMQCILGLERRITALQRRPSGPQ
ncbi:hypothetical protein Tco_1164229 [Tanacetum coccineum]